MFKATLPIGIFDSGIGGLTIAKAVTDLLPNENIIYFADTTHLPYGEESSAAIQAYSIKISNMLLQQGCKLILIACN
jgi:glutamate racemase